MCGGLSEITHQPIEVVWMISGDLGKLIVPDIA